MAAHQAPPSLGFSRQERWSGLPFPSPKHESEKWKGSHSVMSDSLRPHGPQPTRLFCPWDFPGKSTGEGCHRLLRFNLYHSSKFPIDFYHALKYLQTTNTHLTFEKRPNIKKTNSMNRKKGTQRSSKMCRQLPAWLWELKGHFGTK